MVFFSTTNLFLILIRRLYSGKLYQKLMFDIGFYEIFEIFQGYILCLRNV